MKCVERTGNAITWEYEENLDENKNSKNENLAQTINRTDRVEDDKPIDYGVIFLAGFRRIVAGQRYVNLHYGVRDVVCNTTT